MGNFTIILSSVGICLVFVVLAYVLSSYLAIKRRRQHFEQLHQQLAVGQMVEFAGGLRGRVHQVGLDVCQIELRSGGLVDVSRYAISDIVEDLD